MNISLSNSCDNKVSIGKLMSEHDIIVWNGDKKDKTLFSVLFHLVRALIYLETMVPSSVNSTTSLISRCYIFFADLRFFIFHFSLYCQTLFNMFPYQLEKYQCQKSKAVDHLLLSHLPKFYLRYFQENQN